MIQLPVLKTPPESDSGASSQRARFWRSVEHLQGDPEYRAFTGRELMPEAGGSPGQTTRRGFIHIMGASMALAGLSACRKPVETILPFARPPEDTIPGVPMQYASGMEFKGVLRPVLVESTDGRPTKIEGNPEHPESSGSSGVFEQASLLGLYDPDRSTEVTHDGDTATWADFVRFASARPSTESLVFLAAPSSSLTLAALRAQISSRFPSSRWIEYDVNGSDSSASALRKAYGRSLRVQYSFGRAQVILSLDGDFLGMSSADALRNSAGFSASRRVDESGRMSRLYMAESAFSVTGSMADHRMAVKSADVAEVGAAIARTLGVSVQGGAQFDDDPWIAAVAADLRSAGSAGVAVAGDDQPERTHLIAAAINQVLGAVGTTVTLLETVDAGASTRSEDFAALTRDMSAGRVGTLVMLGCNPVYDAPQDSGFAEALSNVNETVHLGLYRDETAAQSSWHVPMTHYLEAWTDGRSYAGTRSVVQPLIAPLYEAAHSAIEVAGLFGTGSNRAGYDLVQGAWRALVSGNFENSWRKILHDGFAPATGYSVYSGSAVGLAAALSSSPPASNDGLEVVFRTSPTVLDGSVANNAWLQELPDPMTKIVWDNVAVMSPATAEKLGLSVRLNSGQHFADRASISVNGETVDVPIWIQHGTAEDSIQLEMGYGREIASDRARRNAIFFDLDHESDIYGDGAIATGVGERVAGLRSAGSLNFAAGASATKTGEDYLIATTQDHGALPEEGAEMVKRGMFRMATLDEYRANPHFVRDSDPKRIDDTAWEDYKPLWQSDHPVNANATKANPYFANQWGMVIDLNACTGCNSCVIACQAENNIQVIGKDQVSRGRELSWIRIDRYFVGGDGDSPLGVVQQPVACVHCENAPCESVCPVAATVHSPDGTNQMIYNRCIGTRYCANNCPYKVRRFNYYNWVKTLPQSLHMAQNPNVTVRSRGVMEKCSYCIQRIRAVNIQVNVEGREIREGDVVTACQQACPAEAIVFGDLNDPESDVVAAKKNPRRYEMLAELNLLPRTSYLGRLRNPNPHLEPADHSAAEQH